MRNRVLLLTLPILFKEKNDTKNRKIGEIEESAQSFLPEYALLEFLLHSPYLMDMEAYIMNFKEISEMLTFDGK